MAALQKVSNSIYHQSQVHVYYEVDFQMWEQFTWLILGELE
jgi:hypothetical protein